MYISTRSYFLSFLIISLLFLAALGSLGYVFLVTDWPMLVKIVAALGFFCLGSMLMHWYQAQAYMSLKQDFTATGHGTQGLFSDLYQNSPVPYLRTNRSGQILHVNAATMRLFKETTEALVTNNLFTYAAKVSSPQEQVTLTLAQLIEAGQFINDVEVQLCLCDGSVRIALLSAFPYEHNTERLVTLIDITDQKAVDTAKSEFVSLASHQLRTPISAVLWNLELLASPNTGVLTEVQIAYIEKIQRSTEKMNVLIGDFLDASKLEMGTFATEVSTVSITSFVRGVLEEFESKIAQAQQTLETDFPSTEVVIETDAQLLRIVVGNLISNAIKYTPAGGLVRVSYKSDGMQFMFRVRDTGIGVPAADQPLLFSKLFRARNTKTSATEGTGLGLYIVRQAVEKMGGTIQFASEEQVGTEFLVTLPLTHS